MSKAISPEIFRKYDIRGRYNVDLFDEDAFLIGAAFADILRQRNLPNKVIVGYDGRLSSPSLHKALIAGLNYKNCKVESIGCVPTPELYYNIYENSGSAGVMITGSHNPKEYNGFKIAIGKKPFFDSDIMLLYKHIQSLKVLKHDYAKVEYLERNETERYIQTLIDSSGIKKVDISKLKIAWDPANGATAEVVGKLCEKLKYYNIESYIVNDKIDGTFPAHHPDPTIEENLVQLKKVVLEEKCDFGIAFDGDGDRIGIVDNCGNTLLNDYLIMLFSYDILKQLPNSTIIADVKTSQIVFNGIANQGGKPLMHRTGHSYIKEKMQESNAVFAGEMSGHLFFADRYYGFDDGIYAGCRFIELVAKSGKTVSQLIASMPKTYTTPEIRIYCLEEEKFALIEEVKNYMNSNCCDYNDLDGLRILKPNGSWWLLRASNTQNCLIARIESLSKDDFNILHREVGDILTSSGVELTLDDKKSWDDFRIA